MSIHIFHNWSEWSRPTQGYETSKVQWAICSICGKVKHRKIGYDNQVSLDNVNTALDEVSSKP